MQLRDEHAYVPQNIHIENSQLSYVNNFFNPLLARR